MKLIALLSVVAMSSVVVAQLPTLDKLNAVRGGIFMPATGDGRSQGSTWTSFGVDFDVTRFLKLGPLENTMFLSIDFYERGSARNLPISLNYKWSALSVYGYVGAGIGFHRGPTGGESAGLGFQAGVGLPFGIGPLPTFVEAKYFLSPHDSTRGIGLYLGVRF